MDKPFNVFSGGLSMSSGVDKPKIIKTNIRKVRIKIECDECGEMIAHDISFGLRQEKVNFLIGECSCKKQIFGKIEIAEIWEYDGKK